MKKEKPEPLPFHACHQILKQKHVCPVKEEQAEAMQSSEYSCENSLDLASYILFACKDQRPLPTMQPKQKQYPNLGVFAQEQ
jgi:hypothetical protein